MPGASRTLAADALDEVWAAADHFVIAAPATAATQHLVGAPQLAAMPPHAWMVNIARGSLIDTDALVAALAARRDRAAPALDVTDPEPLPDGHPLWAEPRALITPHVANPLERAVPRTWPSGSRRTSAASPPARTCSRPSIRARATEPGPGPRR